MIARRWSWLHVALVGVLFAGGAVALAAPAGAVTRTLVVRPSSTTHYVYNCTNPTVEIDFRNVSGAKDVYVATDNDIWLAAQGVAFDPAKVYDAYWHMGGVYQVDVYLTAAGSGPYASRSAQSSTAATSLCPTWYPVYDSHWVDPTPPAGSEPLQLDYLAHFRNND